MSQNPNKVGPGSRTDQTAALIANNAAISSHLVNTSLNGLLGVTSSNETGLAEIDGSLGSIRRDLDSIRMNQAGEEEEIRSLLKFVLEGEVLDYLGREIEKLVDGCVDEAVAQLVEARIGEYIPKSLRDSIDKQRGELDSVRVELYNVEARPQDPAKNLPHEPFRQLLNENDTGSELSPESIDELLEPSGDLAPSTPSPSTDY